MMNSKKKVLISIWWLLQLCGLIFGTRHLGHLLVDILLLSSIAGFVFGKRKTAIKASIGLAAYSALTLIFAFLLCYFLIMRLGSWLMTAIILIVAIINLIISFWTIKTLNNNLLY